MKLGTFVFLGATGLVSVCFAGAGVEGCGGGSTGGSSSSGGGSGSSSGGSGSGSGGMVVAGCDDGGVCVQQPPPPDAAATTSTTPQNFALHHLHLGDELNAASEPDWQSYGYNIDGKDTTAAHIQAVAAGKATADTCTLAANANAKNAVDGEPGGIDNSFGANIVVGLLSAVISNPSATIDTSLAEGHFTVFMNVTGMSGDFGQTATGLTGYILGGVPFAQAPNGPDAGPTFTLSDTWPVDPGSLKNPPTPPSTTILTPIQSTVTFTDSYITGGTFVSGTPTNVSLTLSIDGVPLIIPIQHAIITFNHPGDAGTHNISGGIIAGVIDAEQLVTNLQAVAGNIETSLCQGSTFAQLKQQILGTADIMDDGTNEPGETCNGISIGVGFDADEIAQPTVTGTPSTGTNPCADAGPSSEDAGTDSGAADSGGGAVDAGPG